MEALLMGCIIILVAAFGVALIIIFIGFVSETAAHKFLVFLSLFSTTWNPLYQIMATGFSALWGLLSVLWNVLSQLINSGFWASMNLLFTIVELIGGHIHSFVILVNWVVEVVFAILGPFTSPEQRRTMAVLNLSVSILVAIFFLQDGLEKKKKGHSFNLNEKLSLIFVTIQVILRHVEVGARFYFHPQPFEYNISLLAILTATFNYCKMYF